MRRGRHRQRARHKAAFAAGVALALLWCPSPASSATAARTLEREQLAVLVRATMSALNQANITENYTVFRALAAPGFQRANSAERLAAIFAGLRARAHDFSRVLTLPPKLIRYPARDAAGRLHLAGSFPTTPYRLDFTLVYAPGGGAYRLFAIAVNARKPGAPAHGATHLRGSILNGE